MEIAIDTILLIFLFVFSRNDRSSVATRREQKCVESFFVLSRKCYEIEHERRYNHSNDDLNHPDNFPIRKQSI